MKRKILLTFSLLILIITIQSIYFANSTDYQTSNPERISGDLNYSFSVELERVEGAIEIHIMFDLDLLSGQYVSTEIDNIQIRFMDIVYPANNFFETTILVKGDWLFETVDLTIEYHQVNQFFSDSFGDEEENNSISIFYISDSVSSYILLLLAFFIFSPLFLLYRGKKNFLNFFSELLDEILPTKNDNVQKYQTLRKKYPKWQEIYRIGDIKPTVPGVGALVIFIILPLLILPHLAKLYVDNILAFFDIFGILFVIFLNIIFYIGYFFIFAVIWGIIEQSSAITSIFLTDDKIIKEKITLGELNTDEWDRNKIEYLGIETKTELDGFGRNKNLKISHDLVAYTSTDYSTQLKEQVILSVKENEKYIVEMILEKLGDEGVSIVQEAKLIKKDGRSTLVVGDIPSKCPSCDYEIDADAKFCEQCGTSLI